MPRYPSGGSDPAPFGEQLIAAEPGVVPVGAGGDHEFVDAGTGHQTLEFCQHAERVADYVRACGLGDQGPVRIRVAVVDGLAGSVLAALK